MALIECPECGRDVSSKAEACPNCGNPELESGPVGPESYSVGQVAKTHNEMESSRSIGVSEASGDNATNGHSSLGGHKSAMRGGLIVFFIFILLFGLRDCSNLNYASTLVGQMKDDVPLILDVYIYYISFLIILDLAMIPLFVSKRKAFLTIFKIYCTGVVGLLILDAYAVFTSGWLDPDQLRSAKYYLAVNITSSFILLSPWIIYIYVSGRARRTFVR